MPLRIYIDFGSTFTKVLAIDLEGETVVARTQAVSTVNTDVTLGLQSALNELRKRLPAGAVDRAPAWACSSAAGGLRMVTVGLVPTLTLEAAKRAALGAGAKLVGSFSYKISPDEVRIIEDIRPDILLLSGGTDGGDSDVVLHNARCLAKSSLTCHTIIACNKVAQGEVLRALTNDGKPATVVSNVLPELHRLDTGNCQAEIRRIFMEHIIEAKGIARAKTLIKNVLMPTPAAVLNATQLLSEGHGNEPGLGDLMVIDVGGATTDVHSVAQGTPSRPGARFKGLPEPRAKRTVEGDLGVRHNAVRLLELAGQTRLMRNMEPFLGNSNGVSETTSLDLRSMAESLTASAGHLPSSPAEVLLDLTLARSAIEMAVERHVGTLEVFPSLDGDVLMQRGKDLTAVHHVIGTGGPLVFSYERGDQARLLSAAVLREDSSMLLKPKSPRFLVDSRYLLYAAGLMTEEEPAASLRLMKRYLTNVEQETT